MNWGRGKGIRTCSFLFVWVDVSAVGALLFGAGVAGRFIVLVFPLRRGGAAPRLTLRAARAARRVRPPCRCLPRVSAARVVRRAAWHAGLLAVLPMARVVCH